MPYLRFRASSSRLSWVLGVCLFCCGCRASSDPGPVGRSGESEDGPLRATRSGLLQGVESDSSTWAWLGVPYARAPVGALRWRAPQEPEPWTGVRRADEFGPYCAQYENYITETGGPDSFGGLWGEGVLVGEEDCLYLNLWRPRSAEKGLPVYVFIHGGANFIGRSGVSIYNGARFASGSKVIFVTINYRLGYLGWFAHPALRRGDLLDDSGNYGTLDIIRALRWIQDNISAFGGDPNNVTVSGQSAGAINIYSILASPLAKGLFHRAVIHSGLPWSCPMKSAYNKATTVLSRLLVQDGLARTREEAGEFARARGDTWVRDYLRSRTLEDLFPPENGGPTGLPLDNLLNLPALLGVYEDGTVIPRSPLECLASGEYNQVPLIIGCNTEEFKLFLPLFTVEPGDLWQLIQDFDPEHPDTDLGSILTPLLVPVLFLYEPITMLGKAFFQTLGVDNTAQNVARHQDDVYVFKFAWDEEPEPFDFLIGAAHAMDLPFAFGNLLTRKDSLTCFAWTEKTRNAREAISNAMMGYLSQFARTGNPNAGSHGLPMWTPWASDPDKPARIVFDTGEPYMSSEPLEPQEEPCPVCTLEDILELLLGSIDVGSGQGKTAARG